MYATALPISAFGRASINKSVSKAKEWKCKTQQIVRLTAFGQVTAGVYVMERRRPEKPYPLRRAILWLIYGLARFYKSDCACRKISVNIFSVSRPVDVFCLLGW